MRGSYVVANNGFYEFADFRLDLSDKVLRQGDKQILLTPKVFDTLKVLVENAGSLLEKEELMHAIWPDRFVDEGNLAFNVKVLRRVLGDDANDPKFIETIPRRGYRFIASTRRIEAETPSTDKLAQDAGLFPGTRAIAVGPVGKRSLWFLFLMSALLLCVFLIVGLRSLSWKTVTPVLSAPFSSQKLSNNGKVPDAVISPDGKKVAYVNGTGTEKESVWIRRLETGDNIEIIPPSDDIYGGFAFSPDGNYLYFARKPRGFDGQLDIYCMSLLGGIPERIVSETQGWISVSPDGSKISFVRCYYREDENCSLWIADSANGSNERKLASRASPSRIGDNRFSPDGRSIAFASGQSANRSNDFGVAEVDLATGQERELSQEKFFNIRSMAWLPGEDGLLITASRFPNKSFRIWELRFGASEATPLTNESETYANLSLSTDGAALTATLVNEDFRLRTFDAKTPSVGRVLAGAESTSFAADGRILFSSLMSGSEEIWSMNSDGSSQKQLTNDLADKSAPFADRNNNSIYFASNRSGSVEVWRMNSDGSDPSQLTFGHGGFPLFVSLDNEWVYYQHGTDRTLWRVSTKNGEEQQVLNKPSKYFAFSPNGAQVAYLQKQGDQRLVTIASLSDGQPTATFSLVDRRSQLCNIVWMPDGEDLAYITTDAETGNNVLWKQSLGPAAPRQIATIGNDVISGALSLAVSPDEKTLAVIDGGWRYDTVLIHGLRLH